MILPSLCILLNFAIFAQAEGTSVEVVETQSPTAYSAKFQQILPASQELPGGAMTLSVAGERRQIPLSELRRVQFSSPTAVRPGPKIATLRDGSRFSATTLTSNGQTASFILPSGLTIAAEPKFLEHVQLGELTETQRTQWKAMCESRITADMLVLIRSPESLDKIEGFINGITAETVNFEFNGQSIPAPLTKLAGIRFFSKAAQNEQAPSARLAAVVRDTTGNIWNATQLVSHENGDALDLVLQGGLKFSLPISQLLEIDFSVGSLKYVAEVEPLEHSAVSRFDLGIPVAGSEQVFGARVATPTNRGRLGPSVEFLGSGSASYRIPEGFTRLVGSVELNPPGNKQTPCVVKLLVEKKVVWEQKLTETRQPQPIDIAVQGDQRLQLVVAAESNIPVGDVVLFRELRFLK